MKVTYSVADLVPHSGKMSLLSTIVDYGDEWLQAEVNITLDSMFADAHGVPAWVGLEYMAQTIAAWAGLQERLNGGMPKIGLLLGSRKYICNTDYFAWGQTLILNVHVEMRAENGLDVFNCEIRGKDIEASALVNVFQPDDAEKFLAGAVT